MIYGDFQKKYIDTVSDDALLELVEQKDTFVSFIESLSEEQLNYKYAEGKWTIREVIIHIIDTEIIFNYRALAVLRGELNPLQGFDQDIYINHANLDHLDKEYLINYFTVTRYQSLVLYKGVAQEDWKKVGKISDYEMTMDAFPPMLAGHLNHHVKVLKERYL